MNKTVFIILMWSMNILASVLGAVANSMAPGTWAPVSQTNMGPVLGGGNHTGNLIPYAMSAVWDEGARRLHFLGGDHGCANSQSTHVFYDEASNVWTSLGPVSFTSGCHGWDHLAIDQKNRRLYFSPYGETVRLGDYDLAANSAWNTLGNVPLTGYKGIIRALEWFDGALSGAGTSGALLVYNSQAVLGELLIYDPEKKQWIDNIKGFGGASTYNEFCEYSRVHNAAVFGGGNNNPRKVWRLNGDRTVTALGDAPVNLGVHRANVVDDPATGHFVVWGYGQVWELDPRGTGTWTQQTGSRIPPPAVRDPGLSESGGCCTISSAIPDYGVIAYLSCYSSSCSMYLYKHAAFTARAEDLARPSGQMSGQAYRVFDIWGRRVARVESQGEVRRAGLSAGIYILRGAADGRMVSRRVILH